MNEAGPYSRCSAKTGIQQKLYPSFKLAEPHVEICRLPRVVDECRHFCARDPNALADWWSCRSHDLHGNDSVVTRRLSSSTATRLGLAIHRVYNQRRPRGTPAQLRCQQTARGSRLSITFTLTIYVPSSESMRQTQH